VSSDEKDRFGDKLRDLEHAREEKFFAERDKALLAKLRERESKRAAVVCPVCAAALEDFSASLPGASLCTAGHGVWLSPNAVRALAHETSLPPLRLLEQRLPSD
jgi:hypothetical protein